MPRIVPDGAQGATLNVYNDSGAMVESFELGTQPPGRNEFIWTGMDDNEVRYPVGQYKFVVSTTNNGVVEEAPIFLSSNVNSVTIEPGGKLTLNLAGIGPTDMSEIVQIN